jgi:hypothetical protein
MNGKFLVLVFLLTCTTLYSQSPEKLYPNSIKVSVTNPLKTARENVLVTVSQEQMGKAAKGFNFNSFVVFDGTKEIPSQQIKGRKIGFVLPSLAAGESRALTIRFNPKGETKHNYTKRTQAELSHKTGGEWKNREYIGGAFKNVEYLRVPPEHKDHSWFIRYEGPGWESDKVGYRFYLDQRNATDLFGKKTSDMVMQQVGQDGFDSYHELQPWGMDVMKVGKTLGLGSIGAVLNNAAIRVEKTDSVSCRISDNGTEYSSITTNYYGWKIGEEKVNLQSVISIHAGTRLSHQELTLNKEVDHLCTGLVKDKLADMWKDKGDETHFGYLATYGKQSLNNDELGLVVFFDPKSFKGFTEDEFSHIVALKTGGKKLDYYFLGAWVLEPGGITSKEQFESYVKQVAEELANPVRVQLSSSRK